MHGAGRDRWRLDVAASRVARVHLGGDVRDGRVRTRAGTWLLPAAGADRVRGRRRRGAGAVAAGGPLAAPRHSGLAGDIPGAGDRGGGPGCGAGAIDRGHDRQRHLEDLVLQGRNRLAGDGRADGASVAVAAPGRARPHSDPGPELRRGGGSCPVRTVAGLAATAVGPPELAVLATRPAPTTNGADRGL